MLVRGTVGNLATRFFTSPYFNHTVTMTLQYTQKGHKRSQLSARLEDDFFFSCNATCVSLLLLILRIEISFCGQIQEIIYILK